jgi:large subunit ribosomal protein L30
MKKYKITQVKSLIGATERQRRTMQALGIKKMQKTREKEATPQIEGMVEKLRHLIKIEEV